MAVVSQGRRGVGNLILGAPGDTPDLSMPLPPVVAYGVLETTRDRYTVTVRECVANQIDVEIVSSRQEEIPDHYEEKRRWTYSIWKPGLPSPDTGTPVREVGIDRHHTLAISVAERRIWIHDGTNGMVHLLPITNFYNALMLHQRIRDPKIALASSLLFEHLDRTTDGDLRAAFRGYNIMRQRVSVAPAASEERPHGWRAAVRRLFGRTSHHGHTEDNHRSRA